MKSDKHNGIMYWFMSNPVAANLLMLFILLLGIYSLFSIRVEFFPKFPINIITVSVTYPGGIPQEIEEGIVIKIEEALNGLSGLKLIESKINGNFATIIVYAKEDVDMSIFLDNITSKVNSISSFPLKANKPVIKLEQMESELISVELYGDVNQKILQQTATKINDILLSQDGIVKTRLNGFRKYEINIEINEDALLQYGFTLNDIALAIQNNSINQSSGEIKTLDNNIRLTTNQQAYVENDFKNLIIRSDENGEVRLKELAVIRDEFSEQYVFHRFDGKNAISIGIIPADKSSVTEISSQVKNLIENISKAKWLPDNIKVATWLDESQVIKNRLGLMGNTALMGIILVFVILSLFLNIKIALWVALGVPISFAGTFMLMGTSYLDYSLNELTTFAFIIVVGIIVDDAIVIGESIYNSKQKAIDENKTNSKNQLAITYGGLNKVAIPALFGVLTTIAAFYPLTNINSQLGELFGQVAIVVIICLLFSLVESKLILPAHLVNLKISSRKLNNNLTNVNLISFYWSKLQSNISTILGKIINLYYKPALTLVLNNRFNSLCIFIAMLIFVVSLLPTGVVRTVFFPDVDRGMIFVKVKTDTNTGSKQLQNIIQLIETSVAIVNRTVRYENKLDENPITNFSNYSIDNHTAEMLITLMEPEKRKFSTSFIIQKLRDNIDIPKSVKLLEFNSEGQASLPGIEIQLTSQDHEVLKIAADKIKYSLSQFKYVHDISSNYDRAGIELNIELTAEASNLGLSYKDVATQLSNAIYGIEVQRIQRGRDEVIVKVRYPQSERDQLSDLRKIMIRTKTGASVPLFIVANLNNSSSLSQIDRVNKKRVISVTGSVAKENSSVAEIIAELETGIIPELKKQYDDLSISFFGEFKEEERATESLITGFLTSLLIIYILLAIPLRSYLEPFIIMAVIPFGIIGAILGHYLIGIPISLFSFFGFLAVSGVVVNDALVFTSFYNQLRSQGLALNDALIEAGLTRFRAILLTSLTTFVGLTPMLFERSGQAQILIPMVVSLAFGVLFATVITLFLIPILLSLKENIVEKIKSKYVVFVRDFISD